ncbi:eCIS core domain-containing protein [Nitrobacter sp. TKz-YC02]|uniref:eCIS core domain-containing protein n=1 Tax=Nitrobacter sp. TKz-YC02 TaxID=3398704 RepID=UPI003CF73E45
MPMIALGSTIGGQNDAIETPLFQSGIFLTKIICAVICILHFSPSRASACDPNEKCNRCLVSMFGKCKIRGNDPACEIRKSTCQIPVAGPILTLPMSPLGPGGLLGPGGPGIGPISGESLKSCFLNVKDCPKNILSDALYGHLAIVVDNYFGYLQTQAKHRWRSIPKEIIQSVSHHYTPINMEHIRFATGINTVHGQAITVGNDIFFPGDIDLDTKEGVELLFHEVEHSVQYAKRGGVRPFIAEYVAKSAGKILQKRSVNIHDAIDFEAAAIAKASYMRRIYYGIQIKVQNLCRETIDFALAYLAPSFKATGYWRLNPKEEFYLEDDDRRVHFLPQRYFYYAESIGPTKRVWENQTAVKHMFTVDTDGRRFNFRSGWSEQQDVETVSLTCN